MKNGIAERKEGDQWSWGARIYMFCVCAFDSWIEAGMDRGRKKRIKCELKSELGVREEWHWREERNREGNWSQDDNCREKEGERKMMASKVKDDDYESNHGSYIRSFLQFLILWFKERTSLTDCHLGWVGNVNKWRNIILNESCVRVKRWWRRGERLRSEIVIALS